VKAGENASSGRQTLSTSRASFTATSRGTTVELCSVSAIALRTSSAASAAITRRMSAASARSSSESGVRSMVVQSLRAASARSSGVAPFTSVRTSSSVSADRVVAIVRIAPFRTKSGVPRFDI
jgi:hypothetical protein